MKQFLLLLCLAVFTGSLSAQVYVNAAAAPGGDGTTWATAYNSLSDALTAAPADAELWVAAGTYTTPADSSFYIDKGLSVLGGFAGTETTADAADPATNVTILTGDVMGNDGAAYDSLAYSDNNRVLTILDTSSVGSQFTVTLDGLTITNGGIAENRPTGANLRPYAGAGIFSTAKVAGSRLIFNKNRSNLGSAVAIITGNANESVLDDISLDNNYSGDNRQVYFNGVDGAMVINSSFNSDEAVTQTSGFIQVAFADGFTVDNCTFTNMNSAFSGAGVRSDNCDAVVISNSTFDNLTASSGGAIYHVQADDLDTYEMDEDDFIIDGCTITNCFATGRGGGLTAFNTNIKITNTTLSDNASAAIGGGMYQVPVDGRDYTMVLDNATFTNNTDNGAGGAICLLVFGNDTGNAYLNGTITNSNFTGNTSPGGSGGALYLQSENEMTISNSVFDQNVGGFGTILTRGVTGLTLNNCDFTENGSSADAFQGAGVVGYFDDNSPGLTIDSCTFVDNSVGDFGTITSGGAAIYALGGSAKTIPMQISNTLFQGNGATADQAGGAIYLISGFALTIDDSEFLNNSAAGDGGAINARIGVASRDTSDTGVETLNYEPWDASITNTKFLNQSSGNQGGAVSTQRLGIDFTNCLFVNNIVGGAGSGGAIIFNGNAPGIDGDGNIVNIGEVQIEATFVNNTFVDNAKGDGEGAVGASLALFQPGDTGSMDSNSMKITLTNNAFLSTTGDAAIEVELGADEPAGFVPVGDLIFESLGGNYFNVENDPLVDLGDNGDIVNEDLDEEEEITSLFVDILDDEDMGVNADLAIGDMMGADNPLINNGVINALTPATDILGNPRGNAPDIGAYEADQGAVDTNEPIENSGLEMSFYPNPTIGELNIQNDDASITKFEVIVSDQAGRILKAARFNGVSNRMDFSNLPMGVYNLQLYVNGSVYSKQIVKQ